MSFYIPNIPHCILSHTASLTVASATAEYAIPFSTNLDLTGLGHTSGDSKVYIKEAGDYLISISALIDIALAPTATFDLWVKVNGVNVTDSNTQVGIPNASTTQTLAVSFIQDFNVGDYFELFYHGSTTNCRIVYVAAASTPTRPAAPAIIVTVNKIGN
jgi:hypothetical protein